MRYGVLGAGWELYATTQRQEMTQKRYRMRVIRDIPGIARAGASETVTEDIARHWVAEGWAVPLCPSLNATMPDLESAAIDHSLSRETR